MAIPAEVLNLCSLRSKHVAMAAAGESASTSAKGTESHEDPEGPEAMWRQVIGERSTAVGTFARVRAPKGVRLRKGPSAAHPDLGVLPFDDLVTVSESNDPVHWFIALRDRGLLPRATESFRGHDDYFED